MQLGTAEEIRAQEMVVYGKEQELMAAKLRLRALKGEPLMQSGDSFGVADLQEQMAALQNEFGARNLRAF